MTSKAVLHHARSARWILAAALAVSACGGGSHATAPPGPPSLVEQGAGLVQAKPCLVCHTTNGGSGAGPTFAGLAGSQVKLSDGSTVTADDAYLERSILDPDAQTVAGFRKGLMSSLVPPHSLTTRQAAAIVAYIDTLAGRPSG
ncbi:MAG TPA: c-type cytochrome [Acidimicrobiia bacterium]|nr:c-type cytochrome [Acidimicrobiia bacterium]